MQYYWTLYVLVFSCFIAKWGKVSDTTSGPIDERVYFYAWLSSDVLLIRLHVYTECCSKQKQTKSVSCRNSCQRWRLRLFTETDWVTFGNHLLCLLADHSIFSEWDQQAATAVTLYKSLCKVDSGSVASFWIKKKLQQNVLITSLVVFLFDIKNCWLIGWIVCLLDPPPNSSTQEACFIPIFVLAKHHSDPNG